MTELPHNPYASPVEESLHAARHDRATPRPNGVWIVSIYTAVFMGLAPLFVNLRYAMNHLGSDKQIAEVSSFRLGALIFLAASIIVFAIGVFYGSSKMRYGLIIAVLSQSAFRIYAHIIRAGLVVHSQEQGLKVLSGVVTIIVVTVTVVAYLLRSRSARRFFSGDVSQFTVPPAGMR